MPFANWYADHPCKIHFDMHTPEHIRDVGRDFDAARFAALIADTGANAVCFFARCAYGWAYFPSTVGPAHPHLDRDLFGEGVAALQAEGLRVIAYVAINHAPAAQILEHPDWAKRRLDGEPRAGFGNSISCCVLGPFADELLLPQMEEIAQRYSVDGFFLDGAPKTCTEVCYCDACKTQFGRPIPSRPDDPSWRVYRQWQVQRLGLVMERAARRVASRRPGCLVGVNWLASVRWSVPPPPAVGYLTGDPPVQKDIAFETAFNLAAWTWRDKPADIMTQRMLHGWQDFGCRTPEAIETDFATCIAAGATVFIGDLLQPLSAEPDADVMQCVRTCFDFAREHMPPQGVGTGRRKADIAILSSPESIRCRGEEWRVDERPLRGAFHAVITGGLTADVLFDADLVDHLDRYRTLIMPEQAYVTRAAGEAVTRFVENGGGLLILGRLPRCVDPEEHTSSADPVPFERLSGLQQTGLHSALDLSYLALRGTRAETLGGGLAPRPAVPVVGSPAAVASGDAEVLAFLTAPGNAYQIGARPPGAIMDAPAITRHHAGRGRVLFCAPPLASDIWRRGNPDGRVLLEHMVRELLTDPSTERIGPSAVVVTRRDEAQRTHLHLTAYQPCGHTEMPHIIESPPPVTGVRVLVRDARTPRNISCEPGSKQIPPDHKGGVLCIEVPPFILHTTLNVEWSPHDG
ncbi:MAG: beta-galactosidase trimerization domain-containing protein [Phycisphaerae bacterium]|nr:beta-galactosidase trimerization domain-containing protein [Phycisphaerae bacterium]